MSAEDDRFYDLVWEAWRRGRNPDMVDRDRYDLMLARGWDEPTLSEVMPPEDNPADDHQPTKEEWEEYEQQRDGSLKTT